LPNEVRVLGISLGAAIVGCFAWSGHVASIPISIVFLILLGFSRHWGDALCVALLYYLGSTWALVPGSIAFFGPHRTILTGVALWFLSALLLALPWAVFWSNHRWHRLWLIPLTFVILTLPPLGLFGWASPLLSAGVLFPGAGWLGLLATLAACSVLATPARLACLPLLALSLFCHLRYSAPAPPEGWEAVDTVFGGTGLEGPDPLAEFRSAEWIQDYARSSHAQVLFFPESSVRRWNEATDAFWESTISLLRRQGRTALLGAGITIPSSPRSTLDFLPGHDRYLNVLLARGTENGTVYIQRVPVPIGMWQPFARNGVPLRVFGKGTSQIAGQKVAVLICYEQLLPWPALVSLAEHPRVLVGVANDYWAKGTPVSGIERACLHAWGMLFRLSVLSAMNQ
jgi:hypothetical protein